MAQHTNSPLPRRRNVLSTLRNERGSVLALAVLCLIVFLGLAALAIDLGMLYVARGEAQRAADAAAHGGAAELLHHPNASELQVKQAAVRAGLRNVVRGANVSIELDDVEVLWDERKVRAWVHRTADRENPVRTLFAQVLGIGQVDVAAAAAAEIWDVTHAKCMLPIAIPDRWCEHWINGECAAWPTMEDGYDSDDPLNEYIPYTGPGEAFTGYGEESIGDEIWLRPEGPAGGGQGQGQHSGGTRWFPGWWAGFHSDDPPFAGQDVQTHVDAILNCSDSALGIGDWVETMSGNPANPTGRQGWKVLVDSEDLYWGVPPQGDGSQCVHNGTRCLTPGEKEQSMRVRPVAMFDPAQTQIKNASQPFRISGIASVFIDEVWVQGSNLQVRAIFVGMAGDIPGPGGSGSGLTLKMIRIVE